MAGGGVQDGQDVSAAVTDPAFIWKNANDQMPCQLDFVYTNPSSGGFVYDIQKNINALTSFLGAVLNSAYNALPTWANSNRGTSSDNVQTRVTYIDAAFDASSGHKHTGSFGDAPPISALYVANVPLQGYAQQGVDIASVTGSSSNVSSQLSGYSPSTSTTTPGVVVNTPYNKLVIRNSTNDEQYEDATGNEVYGRLTYSSSVWTLSYYSEIAGTETAYTFATASGIRWYYQILSNPLGGGAPVYSDLFFVPSANATADVIQATTTLQGKTQLASTTPQPVGTTGSAGTPNATVANADHVHALPTTGVTAGSYTNINATVDAYGRVTAISSGTGPKSQTITSTTTGDPTIGVYFCNPGPSGLLFIWPALSGYRVTLKNIAAIGSGYNMSVISSTGALIEREIGATLTPGDTMTFQDDGTNIWEISAG